MATATQKAFARGTVAALDRKEERKTSLLKIDHSPKVDPLMLLDASRHTFAVSGAAARYRISVSLVDGQPDLEEALRLSEERNARTTAKLEEVQQQLAALQAQGQRGDTREWIPIQALADRLKIDYSTVYRAHKAGRLATKITGGVKKDLLLCDPSTYVPAVRKAAKPKQPKSKAK